METLTPKYKVDSAVYVVTLTGIKSRPCVEETAVEASFVETRSIDGVKKPVPQVCYELGYNCDWPQPHRHLENTVYGKKREAEAAAKQLEKDMKTFGELLESAGMCFEAHMAYELEGKDE